MPTDEDVYFDPDEFLNISMHEGENAIIARSKQVMADTQCQGSDKVASRQLRLEKDRKRKQLARSTPEGRARHNAQKRQARALKRALKDAGHQESVAADPVVIQQKRAKDRERKRIALSTPEARDRRNAQDRARYLKRKQAADEFGSSDCQQVKLASCEDSKQKRLASSTPESRARHNAQKREARVLKRKHANEPEYEAADPIVIEQKRAKDRERKRIARTTPEARDRRNAQDRARYLKQKQAADESGSSECELVKLASNEDLYSGPDQLSNLNDYAHQTKWLKEEQKYFKTIQDGPTHRCICCDRLWMQSNLIHLTKSDLCALDFTDEQIQIIFVRNEDVGEFCQTCMYHIRNKIIPSLAANYGFRYLEQPACLAALNDLEEHLMVLPSKEKSTGTAVGD